MEAGGLSERPEEWLSSLPSHRALEEGMSLESAELQLRQEGGWLPRQELPKSSTSLKRWWTGRRSLRATSLMSLGFRSQAQR